MPKINFHDLLTLSNQHGLTLMAALPAEQVNLEEDLSFFKDWLNNKMDADLSYLRKDQQIFSNLNFILPNFKSIITFAVKYEAVPSLECPKNFGRVARYALGRDYHKVLKTRLKKLAFNIEEKLKLKMNYRSCSDAIPILERSLAKQSGLGFIGKNTMLINPKIGSFTLLAEFLSDLEIENIPPKDVFKANCGSCIKCISNCPTGAIIKPYTIDTKLCISYLTIEKRGPFSVDEAKALGDWVFGCDICQEVCPFNFKLMKLYKKNDQEFYGRASVNGLIKLERILSLNNDQAYLEMFNGTPLMRAKRHGLLRNSLAVVANTHSFDLIDLVIERYKNDPDELIRNQALLCLQRLKENADGADLKKIHNAL